VDQGDFTVAAEVRVGIGIRDAAVGRPAGVANAVGAGETVPGGFLSELVTRPIFLAISKWPVLQMATPAES
jgi:hypothetical protein